MPAAADASQIPAAEPRISGTSPTHQVSDLSANSSHPVAPGFSNATKVHVDRAAISAANLNASKTPQIPRIIHHVYKYDVSSGPWPNMIWQVSYNAWMEFYPKPWFEHIFWDDDHAASFFKKNCPEHYSVYDRACQAKNCTMCMGEVCTEIVRSDLSRYCILKQMGGIYADLDYEPRTNFYADLDPTKVNLVQSPYQSETFQNSLMASVAHHPYWNKVLAMAAQNHEAYDDVLSISGPRLLESVGDTFNPNIIHPLPCNEFQRSTHSGEAKFAAKKHCRNLAPSMVNDRSLKGIHWGTVVWMQGSIESLTLFKFFHSSRLWTAPDISSLAIPVSLGSSTDSRKLQYVLDTTIR